MPARPTDIDLARVLTLLGRPLSARDRERCRQIIAGYVLRPAGQGMTAEEAETALLSAAAELAGRGWAEVDIQDLLNDDRACLDRAGRRQGRST